MKICVAQTRAEKGNIARNIENHLGWIELAISEKSDVIIFPELSLIGYEPELANELATDQNDPRLNEFQKISDLKKIVIGIGLPIKSDAGIFISMVLFEPHKEKKVYSKQQVHSDELPFFIQGKDQIILTVKNKKIAPAICYESLQKQHSEKANALGAEIYLASVAKSQSGIKKAFIHYPQIAKRYSMPVLVSNSVGFCDNFLSAGQSAVWNDKGELLRKLETEKEGLLIFDTVTEEVVKKEKQSLTSH